MCSFLYIISPGPFQGLSPSYSSFFTASTPAFVDRFIFLGSLCSHLIYKASHFESTVPHRIEVKAPSSKSFYISCGWREYRSRDFPRNIAHFLIILLLENIHNPPATLVFTPILPSIRSCYSSIGKEGYVHVFQTVF